MIRKYKQQKKQQQLLEKVNGLVPKIPMIRSQSEPLVRDGDSKIVSLNPEGTSLIGVKNGKGKPPLKPILKRKTIEFSTPKSSKTSSLKNSSKSGTVSSPGDPLRKKLRMDLKSPSTILIDSKKSTDEDEMMKNLEQEVAVDGDVGVDDLLSMDDSEMNVEEEGEEDSESPRSRPPSKSKKKKSSDSKDEYDEDEKELPEDEQDVTQDDNDRKMLEHEEEEAEPVDRNDDNIPDGGEDDLVGSLDVDPEMNEMDSQLLQEPNEDPDNIDDLDDLIDEHDQMVSEGVDLEEGDDEFYKENDDEDKDEDEDDGEGKKKKSSGKKKETKRKRMLSGKFYPKNWLKMGCGRPLFQYTNPKSLTIEGTVRIPYDPNYPAMKHTPNEFLQIHNNWRIQQGLIHFENNMDKFGLTKQQVCEMMGMSECSSPR